MKIVLSLETIKDLQSEKNSFYLWTRVLFSNMSEITLNAGISVKVVIQDKPTTENADDDNLLIMAVIIIFTAEIFLGIGIYFMFKKIDRKMRE